jgi:hypothetical protein
MRRAHVAVLLLMGCFKMALAQSAISKANAEHYTWGQGCDGWYLVKNDQVNIIQERMPPGAAETLHKHTKARQFFFVLAGRSWNTAAFSLPWSKVQDWRFHRACRTGY